LHQGPDLGQKAPVRDTSADGLGLTLGNCHPGLIFIAHAGQALQLRLQLSHPVGGPREPFSGLLDLLLASIL
jgi:hypothetical protein